MPVVVVARALRSAQRRRRAHRRLRRRSAGGRAPGRPRSPAHRPRATAAAHRAPPSGAAATATPCAPPGWRPESGWSRAASTRSDGEAAAALLLAERAPTAVTAFNDHCAAGLLAAVRARGVTVPDDLSVVGYDDSHVAELCRASRSPPSPRTQPVSPAQRSSSPSSGSRAGRAGPPGARSWCRPVSSYDGPRRHPPDSEVGCPGCSTAAGNAGGSGRRGSSVAGPRPANAPGVSPMRLSTTGDWHEHRLPRAGR